MEEVIVDSLTNEKLTKKFKNQFELVNYAIQLAGNLIATGRTPRIEVDIQNPAVQALEEIATGRDILEPILERKSSETTEEILQEIQQNTKVVFSDEALEGEMLRISSPKNERRSDFEE